MNLPEPEFKDMYGVANSYTATQMREYRNAALEEAIDKALIALLGADRSLAVRVTAAIYSLKEQE